MLGSFCFHMIKRISNRQGWPLAMEPDRLLLDSNSQQELFVCAPLLFIATEQFWQLSFILCPFFFAAL